jgi:hypothetical protein
MINENFIYLGIAISFLGGLSYLIETIKGKTKPNRVSWFIWTLAPLIAFSATIKQGVGVQSLITLMAGFNPLMVSVASFVNKKSYWRVTRLDLFCGGLAIMGLILWKITGTGNMAIFFSIMADALAAVPTIIKSYVAPETENGKVYLASGIAGLIGLLTIKIWRFEQFAFPLYFLLMNIVIYIPIRFKLGKRTVY